MARLRDRVRVRRAAQNSNVWEEEREERGREGEREEEGEEGEGGEKGEGGGKKSTAAEPLSFHPPPFQQHSTHHPLPIFSLLPTPISPPLPRAKLPRRVTRTRPVEGTNALEEFVFFEFPGDREPTLAEKMLERARLIQAQKEMAKRAEEEVRREEVKREGGWVGGGDDVEMDHDEDQEDYME